MDAVRADSGWESASVTVNLQDDGLIQPSQTLAHVIAIRKDEVSLGSKQIYAPNFSSHYASIHIATHLEPIVEIIRGCFTTLSRTLTQSATRPLDS